MRLPTRFVSVLGSGALVTAEGKQENRRVELVRLQASEG